ncbi:MAG: UDP-N-acetylmuramyl-tripeptide synthetase, partial [Acidimicrobiales bacterium]|nr:UDP-N-acetylmuramyl-tripeptide synthetase [Acidimicrobiales bacterium]
MRLERLTAELDVLAVEGDAATEVTAVTHDSRAVVPGALFCCVPGERADGHAFAPEAVARGAVALLCARPLGLGVPEVRVDDVRAAMGPAAAAVHDHPSAALPVVGVTGTNGKTTTTWLLQAVLEAAGRPTGLIGTLSGARTTPEAPDLQARLAELRDEGRRAVAMEVSSHALALHRVDGTRFAVAVFTNLGRDHLDFHDSLEDYFAAKARLFG